MGRYYENEFIIEGRENMCTAMCPQCRNVFLVGGGNLSRSLNCVKCGSEWYATRKKKE